MVEFFPPRTIAPRRATRPNLHWPPAIRLAVISCGKIDCPAAFPMSLPTLPTNSNYLNARSRLRIFPDESPANLRFHPALAPNPKIQNYRLRRLLRMLQGQGIVQKI